MKTRISRAVLAVVMFAAVTQAAEAQDNSDRFAVPLSDPSKPALVNVNLLNGSISVRTHTGKDIIVEGSAVARRGQNTTTRDGLRRLDTPRGLVIEEANNVVSVSSQGFSNSGGLEIQVPVKTNLKLRALNGGAIIVDGVDGEIDVQNTNGSIRLTNVSGSVVAHASNGNVLATVREVTPNKPMSFSSMNSNVDVTLPASTKANLKIRSDNGAAYSDFDVKLNPSAPPVTEDTRTNRGNGRFRIQTDHTTTGTINGGGLDVEIRTLNGNIFLRKGK